MYQGLQFGENMARQFSIFKFMFVVGYYNEFIVLQRQILCKLFAKANFKKMHGMNPMSLSDPSYESLEIIALQPVKILR